MNTSVNADFEQYIRGLLPVEQRFALQTLTGLLILHLSEILYFQYDNDSRIWKIVLTNLATHKLRSHTTAKEILNISPALCQVSQNCIINIDRLAAIENKTLRCIFHPPHNTLNISVSRQYYSKLKKTLEII